MEVYYGSLTVSNDQKEARLEIRLPRAGYPKNEVAFNDRAGLPVESSHSDSGGSVVITLALSPEDWTKAMEREFRRLVLAEAKGALTAADAARLEQLNHWRDQLNHPRPTEEILAQLRRDRVLDRIAQSLKDYVEFQEGPGKKRASSR
jgi:hypothetical protein